MSIWTSERRPGAAAPAVAALAALALTGCLAEGGFRAGAAEPAPVLRVAGGAVAVAGPPGYCVDPVATRDTTQGAFVLLGACAALAGSGAAPARRAALTAAVSPPGDGPAVADSSDSLTAFFASEAGRRLLSRSGDADSVRLVSSHLRDGVLYLRLRDDSGFDGAEVLPDYWRAVLDAGPHVVSLATIPLASRPLRPEATLALLEDFVARTRAENARAARQAVADATPASARSLPDRARQAPAPRPRRSI